MSDELDTLPDAKLAEVFALEVAGWTRLTKEWCDKHFWTWPRYGWMPAASTVPHDGPIFFSTSADAVLPFLEKFGHRVEWGRAEGCQYGVYLWPAPYPCDWIRSIQPTFARAACIALIRAKRAKGGVA